MPSGKIHDKITFSTSPIVALGTYALTNDINLSILSTSTYIFSGLMFSGDLDLNSRQQNRWKFLKFIWKPYSRVFKHRSFFTHGIFIATLIRLLYLEMWIFLLMIPISWLPLYNITPMQQFNMLKEFIINNKELSLIIYLSLCLGSFSHTFSDICWSKIKSIYRNI